MRCAETSRWLHERPLVGYTKDQRIAGKICAARIFRFARKIEANPSCFRPQHQSESLVLLLFLGRTLVEVLDQLRF